MRPLPRGDRTLRERALAALTRREYSRQELRQRLLPHAQSPDEIDRLLDDLIENKLLSDERYAEARSTSLGRRYGAGRVKQELRARGVNDALVRSTVAAMKGDELARARAVWSKRFGVRPTDAASRAKQTRFLAGRGFGFDIIRTVIGGEPEGE